MNRIALRYNKIKLKSKVVIKILSNVVKFSFIIKYRKIKIKSSMMKALCDEGVCKIDAKELTKTYLTDNEFKVEFKKGWAEERNKKSK